MLWSVLFAGALASDWAVLVSTSNSWYDYRHSSNVLAMHEQVRLLGVPESNTVLLNAGQHQCNPRNLHTGSQMISASHEVPSVKADYVSRHVTTQALRDVLMGRGSGKSLATDQDSRILLYITGHGGDGVVSFQDEPLHVQYLDEILNSMWTTRRYKEILLVVDSCQGSTMLEVTAPHVQGIASAARGQPSWSRKRDPSMGISLIDEFTSTIVRDGGDGGPTMLQAFFAGAGAVVLT